MNKITKLTLVACLAVFFTSCGLMRRANEKYDEESAAGYDKTKGTFVLKIDSTEVKYDGLKIKSPLFGKTKFILDKEIEIPAKEVLAYQTASTYYTWTQLCGWTTRRLEIAAISKYQGTYSRSETTTNANGGMSTRNRTYFQDYLQKDNNALVLFTPKNLYGMVTDYSPSVELLDDYFKNKKKYSSIGWLNTGIYFVGLAMTVALKNDANGNAKVSALNYAGLGVSAGSIVYGFINRKKKRTNNIKVTEALDEYNSYKKRKK